MTSPTPEATPGRTEEIRPLTGLRIVAALWVVLFHLGFTAGLPGDRFWVPFRPVIDAGALGVDLFYVLSGFVITLTYLDTLGTRPAWRSTVGFWWARFSRIWPVYATATTLFGLWLLAKHLAGAQNYAYQTPQPVLSVWHYVQQLAMVQLWTHTSYEGTSFVGPAWSISAEWLAYTCFPLLALGLWRLRRTAPLLTGIAASACMVPLTYLILTTGTPYHPWSWLLRIAMGFLAGSLTCLAFRRIRITPRVDRTAAVVAVVVVLAILASLWLLRGHGAYGGILTPMAVVFFFPLLVGSLALSSGGLSRLLSTRLAVHGGHISYSLYLVHMCLIEVLWTGMGLTPVLAPGTPLYKVLVPGVVVLALLLAHLSYRFIEEPARRALRARGPGAWARRAPRVRRVTAAEGAPEAVAE